MKSEEFRDLDSNSLALLVFQERKSDRNHYDITASIRCEVDGKVQQTRRIFKRTER